VTHGRTNHALPTPAYPNGASDGVRMDVRLRYQQSRTGILADTSILTGHALNAFTLVDRVGSIPNSTAALDSQPRAPSLIRLSHRRFLSIPSPSIRR